MKFLTGKSLIIQGSKPKKWITLHNQLFKDSDDEIYLVPKNYETDGYTIPLWLAWLGGGNMQWDIRPAIGHDFECEYHQKIRVLLNEKELRRHGYLRLHEKKNDAYQHFCNLENPHRILKKGDIIVVCEDIPAEYLRLEKATFNEVNRRFKRMMMATEQIKHWRANMMRFAVNFNVGWIKSGKIPFNIESIYKKAS